MESCLRRPPDGASGHPSFKCGRLYQRSGIDTWRGQPEGDRGKPGQGNECGDAVVCRQGLVIAHEKTEVILLTGKRISKVMYIQMEGHPIRIKKEIKDTLG